MNEIESAGYEKIKIGILTEYYESLNYGGNLQAYALTRFLNKNIGLTEQIPYKRPSRSRWSEWKEEKGIIRKVKLFAKKTIQRTLKRQEFERIRRRHELVKEFGRVQIPHLDRVYTDEDLKAAKCNPDSETAKVICKYSVFITGSDQVWRHINKEAYFLTFVPEQKRKISYAASISKPRLQKEEQIFFNSALKGFSAISVREKSDIDILKGLCNQQIEWVLDPTLLLNEREWGDICSPPLINDKYVFCYFLGRDEQRRKLARIYAQKYGFKLVTMPYLTSEYPFSDFLTHKNEEKLFEVRVEDFLSLIRYADMVFTDSFHAVVFSGIFKRQYYVFDRAIGMSMNSRINSLLDIFEAQERFCSSQDRESIEYLEDLKPLDYSRTLPKLEKMRNKSKAWIYENVK